MIDTNTFNFVTPIINNSSNAAHDTVNISKSYFFFFFFPPPKTIELDKLQNGGQPFTDKVSFNFGGTGGKESIIPFGLKAIRFIQRTSRVKCAAVRCKLGQQYVIRFSRPLLPLYRPERTTCEKFHL